MMDDHNRSQSSSQPQPVNPSTPQPVQAAGDPAPPEPLTPEELAAVLLARIDEIEALVPNFQHHDKNDIRRVAGMARFASELVVPTIATVTSFGPAAEPNMFDVAPSRKVGLLQMNGLRSSTLGTLGRRVEYKQSAVAPVSA